MSDPQPAMPPTPEPTMPPFVQIAMQPDGSIQFQSNLKDRALILGLLEAGKFTLMLQGVQMQQTLVKPNGRIDGLLKRMGA